MTDPNLSSFLWSVADLLRGDFKQSEYGKVILPFTVLRRLDCVLAPTKAAVLAELAARTKAKVNPEPFLLRKAGQHFYNTSPLDLKKLVGDQDHIGENLRAYLQAFSPAVRDIFEHFDFHTQIDRLQKANLLYLVAEKFGYRTITVERPARDAKGKVVLGTKVGYEIPFNRHFCVFKPPRPLAEIDKEPKVVTDRILKMIGGLSQ